jgi:hypothetical protein
MRINHALFAYALCAATLAALSSCASAPKTENSDKPPVSARLVAEDDIYRHGVGNGENPFIVPIRIFDAMSGGRKEFVIMNFELNLPQSAIVNVDADVKDSNGEIIGRLYSKDDLIKFWKSITSGEESSITQKRVMVLDWYYVPSLEFKAKAGHREYYVVCVGKAPIARPSTAELAVIIGDADPQFFYFDLLPKTGKDGSDKDSQDLPIEQRVLKNKK